MTTYTIKADRIDTLCLDVESATHIYTLAEIIEDAANFAQDLAAYITENLDVHQDNPMNEDELLALCDIDTLAKYMDDSIREAVHAEMAPCTDAEFVREYLRYADLVV